MLRLGHVALAQQDGLALLELELHAGVLLAPGRRAPSCPARLPRGDDLERLHEDGRSSPPRRSQQRAWTWRRGHRARSARSPSARAGAEREGPPPRPGGAGGGTWPCGASACTPLNSPGCGHSSTCAPLTSLLSAAKAPSPWYVPCRPGSAQQVARAPTLLALSSRPRSLLRSTEAGAWSSAGAATL